MPSAQTPGQCAGLHSISEQSRLLTVVTFVFIASYLVLAYWLFFIGLRFIGGGDDEVEVSAAPVSGGGAVLVTGTLP